jgi:hypothetical protein
MSGQPVRKAGQPFWTAMPPSPKAGQLFGKAVPPLAKADRLFEKGGAVSLAAEEFTQKMPFLT